MNLQGYPFHIGERPERFLLHEASLYFEAAYEPAIPFARNVLSKLHPEVRVTLRYSDRNDVSAGILELVAGKTV